MSAVIVFAKAPQAGLAKTRLAPVLGSAGAAQLAERMLRHTVQQALDARLGPVMLCVTPDGTHPAFVDLAAWPGLQLSLQGDGDLGARMARAFEQLLGKPAAAGTGALLIGTDAPALDADYLHQADQALRTHDAVFGPAADGGYVLVGLQRLAPALFNGMRWSHDQVMADTRKRLRQCGLRHAELPTLHDVDEAADLVHAPADWLTPGST